jgi:hypothetical protein
MHQYDRIHLTAISLAIAIGLCVFLFPTAPTAAQSTLYPRPLAITSGLVQPEDLWHLNMDVLVSATGTLFLPLPGNVATTPGGIIIQDGLGVLVLDASTSGAEVVDLVRAAQAGPANQPLLYGNDMVSGWHSSAGVAVFGEASNGVGLGLRKSAQGGAPVLTRVAISGRVAQ